jgi:4-alpha-glucanotransferase
MAQNVCEQRPHLNMTSPRTAGVTLPLFSIRTRRDWGIGQITDLPAAAAWTKSAGHTLLQLLPPHELSNGETSPYGALTAFGIDPIYVGLEAVPDLDEASIAAALGAEGERELSRVREAAKMDYRAVRALKLRAFRAAFERFATREWERSTPRAQALQSFIEKEREWLDDLALYTALRETHASYGWETWPEEERERIPRALDRARGACARRILEVAYQQWTLHEQWARAKADMHAIGVQLMGDLPFVVCGESADVWARASQFQRHMSLGAPPDAFSPDGQDWGLPPYNWLTMESDDLAWVRARTRQASRLYDRFRLDHVVGFFRQWVRAKGGGKGRFDPDGPDAQRARGLRVLGAILEEARAAATAGDDPVIAEDLGVIPPFVRETLRDLGLPGYRVIPWEKDGDAFRDPAAFPTASVATWSTHDTAPITAWWRDFSDADKTALAGMASFEAATTDDARSLALLDLLFRSRSSLTLVLAQELLGDRERINTPGTVGGDNWTYRLPQTLESLAEGAKLSARFAAIRAKVEASGR